MQRFVRRKNRPQPGRGPTRWTAWEIALIALSILLIVFPLYTEGYRWLNPLVVPAAPRLQQSDATATSAIVIQRATFTPVATSPGGATDTPVPTATTGASPAPSDTPTTGPSPVPSDTPTTGPSPVPSNTPTTGPSAVATSTATAGPSPTATATLTPLPNEPPLRVDKAVSASSVQV